MNAPDKCHDCPHAGPCLGAASPPLCELKRRDARYLALVRGEIGVTVAAPVGAHPTPTPAARPAREAIGRQRLLVLGCDYRGPVVSRGCSCRHACFRGECGGAVTYGDCLRCVGAGPVH